MILQHSNSDKIVYNANAKKLKTFRKLEGLSQNQFAEKYEIPFKEFGGITRTCSCHHKRKTYYLTENTYNLNALSEIRKNIVE